MTVKLEALLAVPPGVVTLISPDVAPNGAGTVIELSDTTVKPAAAVPLNVTDVAPVNPLPVIVTIAPIKPEAGANEVITGGGMTVNALADVTLPPGVVIEMGPVVAATGAFTVMRVSDTTVNNDAGVPLNATDIALDRPLPVTVTTVPAGPEPGVNAAITGGGMTVNAPLEMAIPPGVVTWIGPVAASAGTPAVMVVSETTVNTGAAAAVKLTALAPVSPVPVMVTVVPRGPAFGVNEVITGGGMTVNALLDVTVPPGVTMVIGPDVAPAGTVVVIVVSEAAVNTEASPLNVTEAAPVSPVPVIVTVMPVGPAAGVNAVITGGGMTVNALLDVTVPPGVTMVIGPDVAPAGTVVVID